MYGIEHMFDTYKEAFIEDDYPADVEFVENPGRPEVEVLSDLATWAEGHDQGDLSWWVDDTGTSHVAQSAAGRVEITIELDGLAGLKDGPGDLGGFGPVIADIARRVVAENIDGEWRYVVTDRGRPVATGTSSRRPTESIKRRVRVRYRTCVFPGCRMPATDSDLDHRTPVAECGKTTTHDMAPLCRRHHNTNHVGPWRLVRLPNGDHQWTSRLGHAYTTSGLPP